MPYGGWGWRPSRYARAGMGRSRFGYGSGGGYGGRTIYTTRKPRSRVTGVPSSALAIAQRALSLAKAARKETEATKQMWPTSNVSSPYAPSNGNAQGYKWCTYFLNRVSQGDDEHDRIGDNIQGHSFRLKYDFTSDPPTGTYATDSWVRRMRVIVFVIKGDVLGVDTSDINSYSPAVIFEDYLYDDAGTVVALDSLQYSLAMYKRENAGSIKILDDRILEVNQDKRHDIADIYLPFKQRCVMLGETTTTTAMHINGVFLMAIALDGTPTGDQGQPKFKYASNFYFSTA